MTGSQRAYAKHRKQLGLSGGTLAAVQKALASERITKGSDGKIDFERADRDWEQNLNRKKRTVSRLKKVLSNEQEKDSLSKREDTDLGSFLEAQKKHEWLKVEKEELELRRRRGELLERSEAKDSWGKLLRTFTNRMLYIPGRISRRLALSSNERECRKIIEGEIKQALTALNEYEPNAA